MIDRITSKANQRVKDTALLKNGPKDGCFLVEGFHLVEMAFKAGCLQEVFAVNDPRLQGIDVHLVPFDVIEKLSHSKTPEPIVGVAALPSVEGHRGQRILFLDRVQDPGNVGTLIRTGLCFGFKDVILTKGSANPFSPKAIAASQGAIFEVKAEHGVEGEGELLELKKQGYTILGSSLDEAKALGDYQENPAKLCLMLGNEGQGLDKKLLALSDVNLFIEIADMESLNVGVAGGVLMYRFRKEGSHEEK